MKKTILTIAGSALIALSTVQLAAATEYHRGKARHQAYSELRDSRTYTAFREGYAYPAFGDSYAYAPPAYFQVPREVYGWSNMAGR
jgi:hypothetical protein